MPRLLVASDYDGTLAPIVSDPSRAFPLPAGVDALRALASLPSTSAALISGRALRDLARLSGLSSPVHLVGSHGAEFDADFADAIDPAARSKHRQISSELAAIADEYEGVTTEVKPASVALHVRNASAEDGAAAFERAHAAARSWDAQLTTGKAVLEFAVIDTDKGQALDTLREKDSASAVVFLGDDVTDEKAFRRLVGSDVGVKVGSGESLAGYRVESPEDVSAVLEFLLSERR